MTQHAFISGSGTTTVTFTTLPSTSGQPSITNAFGSPSSTFFLQGLQTPTLNTNAEANSFSSFSYPGESIFLAGSCGPGGVAGSAWGAGTFVSPTPTCIGGGTDAVGTLAFARGSQASINFVLPADWNSSASTDLSISYQTSDTTAGHVTAWDISEVCWATDGKHTGFGSTSATQTISNTIPSGAVSGGQYVANLTGLNMTSPTGCAPQYQLVILISRNNSGVDTNIDTSVLAIQAQVIFGRTITQATR